MLKIYANLVPFMIVWSICAVAGVAVVFREYLRTRKYHRDND